MSAFRRILVPTDFSAASEHALALAIDLARTFGARLTLLHVWSIGEGRAPVVTRSGDDGSFSDICRPG